MLTANDILEIKRFETKLPDLSIQDLAYIVGHRVALETAGITSDAAKEKHQLERLILQFGWRLAYCRYVDNCLNQFAEPCGYDDWLKSQKSKRG